MNRMVGIVLMIVLGIVVMSGCIDKPSLEVTPPAKVPSTTTMTITRIENESMLIYQSEFNKYVTWPDKPKPKPPVDGSYRIVTELEAVFENYNFDELYAMNDTEIADIYNKHVEQERAWEKAQEDKKRREEMDRKNKTHVSMVVVNYK